ncbi:MAG: dimethylamine monooxygenase subunit DmmA family protein [Burkholderiaceae bacterium]
MASQTMAGPRASDARDDVVSRPVYQPFRPDASGRTHVALADASARDALARFVDDAVRAGLPLARVRVLDQADSQVDSDREADADAAALALRALLDDADMGTRLYLLGAEHTVWPLARLARELGLMPEAIHVWSAGRARRPVYCVHCRTRMPDCERTVVPCAGCGRALGVRDHFSRELGAYLGVRIDAEHPGRIPAAEALQP